MDEFTQIRDQAPKPPGLLPKNVQSWLLLGIALLMVTIMWLTGGKKPPSAARSTQSAPSAPAPLEVNETKIAELQSRIQELQREQLAAQNALAQQTRLLDGATPDSARPDEPNSGLNPQREEDPIREERKKLAYTSLFASNVALSYRKPLALPSQHENEPRQTPGSLPPLPEAPPPTQLLGMMPQLPAISGQAPAHSDSTEPPLDRKEEERKTAAAAATTTNAAAGKNYILFEGTILEAVLVNRLDGGFSGPVDCLLSNDVYSNDRQHLLIPAGSRLSGATKKVDTFGQTRLVVVFHRLVMPDGYSVSLDQFKGLDQIGDTGLRDQVNNHYLRIFGASLALGAIGAVAEAGTGGALNASGGDLMRQGFAQSTAQSATQILNKFLNVMPTVTIREGHRIKVYLAGDLTLPDYNLHKMPSDL